MIFEILKVQKKMPNNIPNIKWSKIVRYNKSSNVYLDIFAYKVNQTHYFTTERSNFFIKILINRLLLTVYHSTRDNVSFE